MKKLIIKDIAKEVMVTDAVQTFPNECCGFFYGHENETERHITQAQVVINSKEGDQRRRFEISPLDYMKAENYALANNLTLLGVYHSHPNHPAIPSEHDLAKAMPFFSYIIISVQEGNFADFRSWQLDDNQQFAEETLAFTTKVNS